MWLTKAHTSQEAPTSISVSSSPEGELITNILKNETSQNIENMLFSIRIGNSLKNKIECRFIAELFKEKE